MTTPTDLEIKLVLDTIESKFGYDFHNYAEASMRRRLESLTKKLELNYLSEIIPKIIHEKNMLKQVINGISVPVSEMFRDPMVHQNIREEIFPVLASFPQIKIWVAGCANGEEAFSMAIALEEEGLLNRSQIYATDINLNTLEQAETGVFPVLDPDAMEKNYLLSGGKRKLSDHLTYAYGLAKMNDKIRKHVLFSNHNLITDGVFGDFNLILCRNVMIYFKKSLKEKALSLFHDSLGRKGFLCLGTKDHAPEDTLKERFETLSRKLAVYQKIAEAR